MKLMTRKEFHAYGKSFDAQVLEGTRACRHHISERCRIREGSSVVQWCGFCGALKTNEGPWWPSRMAARIARIRSQMKKAENTSNEDKGSA